MRYTTGTELTTSDQIGDYLSIGLSTYSDFEDVLCIETETQSFKGTVSEVPDGVPVNENQSKEILVEVGDDDLVGLYCDVQSMSGLGVIFYVYGVRMPPDVTENKSLGEVEKITIVETPRDN